MVLRRWEPFGGAVNMRDAMGSLFPGRVRNPFWARPDQGSEGTLRLDAYHTPEALVIKATVPGVKAEEVEVTVTGNTLTIRGEARDEREVKEESYLVRERRYGAFHRSVTLPRGLKTGDIEATHEDGVLTLTIPRAEEAKPRAITVQVKKATQDKTAA